MRIFVSNRKLIFLWYLYLLFFVVTVCIIEVGYEVVTEKYFLRTFSIPTESSVPTLLLGDRLVAKMALTMTPGVKRGELIIFRSPKDPSLNITKRAIAVGGDIIEITGKKVSINGTYIEEPYAIYTGPSRYRKKKYGPFEVPADSVFVLGDNRD